jgi:hypothetical protein
MIINAKSSFSNHFGGTGRSTTLLGPVHCDSLDSESSSSGFRAGDFAVTLSSKAAAELLQGSRQALSALLRASMAR